MLVVCGCVTRTDLFDASEDIASCPGATASSIGVWQDVTPSGVHLDESVNNNRGVISMARGRSGELLVGTTYQGLWRTRDCGDTWSKVDTGAGSDILDQAELQFVVVDPRAPDVIYTTATYFGGSIWQSTNAGVDWQQILPASAVALVSDQSYIDIAAIVFDPSDSDHVIASYRTPWTDPYGHSGQDAGVIEGRFDGLNWTWQVHEPAVGMGIFHSLAFLGDSGRWLAVATYNDFENGSWRTLDGGTSFTKVSDNEHAQGYLQVHAPSGTNVFQPGEDGLFRSVDDGATFTDVLGSGAQGITSDGEQIYVSSHAFEGDVQARLFVGPLDASLGAFNAFGALDVYSAWSLEIEPSLGVLYSVNGLHGLRRMRVR